MSTYYFERKPFRKPPLADVDPEIWEDVGGEVGVAALEENHPSCIALKVWCRKRIGGVRIISKEEYKNSKKNPIKPKIGSTWSESTRDFRVGTEPRRRAVEDVGDKPAPVPVESEPVKPQSAPQVAKMKEVDMSDFAGEP